MNLVRKLKISKIMPIEFSDSERKLMDVMDVMFDNLICIELDNFSDNVFYLNNDLQFLFYTFPYKNSNNYVLTNHITKNICFGTMQDSVIKNYICYYIGCLLNHDTTNSDIGFSTSYYEDICIKLRNKYYELSKEVKDK